MDSTTAAVQKSHNSNPPFMILPAHVDGFIDLKTLADIHRFLNQSELEEDLALAAWVKEYYLYEPMKSDGREIRTTEGFSKLDRAYRRVRSLTNKAQDKWPFFDRNWKSMSSTTVRNNARGEAAPGVSLLGMSNAAHDSPMSSAQDARRDESSPVACAFVSFGPNKPVRHQHHRQQQQSFARPVPNTPVPIPSSKKATSNGDADSATCQDSEELLTSVFQPQPNSSQAAQLQKQEEMYQDAMRSDLNSAQGSSAFLKTPMRAHSESAGEAETEDVQAPFEELASRSTSATAISEAPQTSDRIKVTTNDVSPDSGRKVRGPNGRFMSREEARLMTIARSKSGKKSRFAKKEASDAKDIGSSSPLPAELDDTIMVDAPSTPASAIQHNSDSAPAEEQAETAPDTIALDAPNDHFDDEPASGPSQDSLSVSSSTLAYTLAAEADPVPSNLDRLPPLSSLRKLKRKSESTAQEGPRRKRGRPRLSEQRRLQAETDVAEAAEQTPTPAQKTAVVQDEAPRMATRRSTRRSGVAIDQTTPAKTASLPSSTKTPTQTATQEDSTMIDAGDGDVNAGQKAASSPPVVVKLPPPRITRAKASAIVETPSQPTVSAAQDASDKENIDALSPSLAKTNSITRRSGPKKPVNPEPGTDVSAAPNGTSKTPAESEVKSVADTPPKPETIRASLPIHGAQSESFTDDAATIQGRGKVEFFARVHTATGIVEVPVNTDDLSDDVGYIHKYAEWSKKEKVPIDYHAFKSVFGFAKKG